MARERLSMRKIKEVLRLKSLGLTNRQIAGSIHVARSTIAEYLKRAKAAEFSWPLSSDLDDATLEKLLFPVGQLPKGDRQQPDCNYIHSELKKNGVTLMLLWEEYLANNTGGYRYTQFCHHYRMWRGHISPSMRQVHRAGEKMFVDFAGHTIPVVNRLSGEIKDAQIFVAVLGASNYTYSQAVWSQDLPNWIDCHAKAFKFFGGVTKLVIPDNLKAGVSKPCRYEPDLNPTYRDMADHYGTVVIPARVRKPKDKPKVEVGVQVVERWILARLRNRTFFSLGELNQAMALLLEKLNKRAFAKLEGCRRSLFETIDKPALLPLPTRIYEFAEWRIATVNIDYHIEVDRHYYSVPYQLLKQRVDVRITKSVVEILFKGRRVASHVRSYEKGKHSTALEHMPRGHREYLEWSPSRIISWAKTVGPECGRLVEAIMSSRKHPTQGYRSALGIMRLTKTYSSKRLEAAAARALEIGALSFKSVSLMLKNNLENETEKTQRASALIEHDNIRGANYYH